MEAFLMRWWIAPLAALATLMVAMAIPMVARADGILPPQPYRYLHPPPSLAAENSPPEAGVESLKSVQGRSKAGFLFTKDTQAGLIVPAGAFVTAPTATSVIIQISPVETPPGLPQHYAPEGNAYSVTASGEPGNAPVRVVRPVNITLRWPHPPLAIYVYAGAKWKQVCYSDNATFTTSTMACPTSTLGIFTAVTNPALTGTAPTAPSSSRFAWLNRYIPFILVLFVVVVVALVALITMRPSKKPSGGS
jgi:hypothetical protein